MNDSDHIHMQRAFALAKYQNGRTGSNPSVGCVIIDQHGRPISEAATGDGGYMHAEQLALRHMPASRTAGATAYVTLEPCRARSSGEIGCSGRLIAAGVSRTIIAVRDPHPQGRGGINFLDDAGITVELGLMQAELDTFYKPFFISASKVG